MASRSCGSGFSAHPDRFMIVRHAALGTCRIRRALASVELRPPPPRPMLQPKRRLPFWAEQIRQGNAHSWQPPRVWAFPGTCARRAKFRAKADARTKHTLAQRLDRCDRAHYSNSAMHPAEAAFADGAMPDVLAPALPHGSGRMPRKYLSDHAFASIYIRWFNDPATSVNRTESI